MSFHWTPEVAAHARKLYIEDGLSASAVAKLIGASSRNAVIGKAHREGWEGRVAVGRASQVRAATIGGRTMAARRQASRTPAEMAEVEKAKAAAAARLARPVRDQLVVASNPKPWAEREAGECAYPVSGQGADTRSCCAPAAPGAAYCAGHARAMRVPRSPAQAKADRRLARWAS